MSEIKNGVFNGNVLIQEKGSIGGAKHVFVKLQGQKDWQVFPTFGAKVKNPFKGTAKLFAGDLVEYRTDDDGLNPELYILKTFKVAATVGETDTVVYIERDGYKHVPFVGDILMKAPTAFATAGAGYAVTAVEETTHSEKDVWKITVATTLGALSAGDILVEAAESGASVKMMVQNPNMICPNDYDFVYFPLASSSNQTGARYYFTPIMHGVMYTNRMSPMPAVVKGINKSNVNGWFEL